MTPEKRLQHAAQTLQVAARLTKEAQAAVRLALQQFAKQKAAEKPVKIGVGVWDE
jgi:hypothetical protein